MSQAHYLRCYHCPAPAIAVMRSPVGTDWLVCVDELNSVLDICDVRPHMEPLAIEWVYDAGIPHCGIHHWPAELCEGWSHRPLIERLRATYADGRPSARSDDPT